MILVQSGNGLHGGRIQFEIKHGKIAAYALGIDRFRDDDHTVLHMPADDHLRRRLAQALRDVFDDRISQRLVLRQRAPCLGADIQSGQRLA